MAVKKTNLFLYLTRRDKTGIRVLAIFQSLPRSATRIEDLTSLQIPPSLQQKLQQAIYDSRMLWEPWIESADDYNQLVSNLKLRGYTNIPINLNLEISGLETFSASVSQLPIKNTMLRKN
jgi:hypothetical protein